MRKMNRFFCKHSRRARKRNRFLSQKLFSSRLFGWLLERLFGNLFKRLVQSLFRLFSGLVFRQRVLKIHAMRSRHQSRTKKSFRRSSILNQSRRCQASILPGRSKLARALQFRFPRAYRAGHPTVHVRFRRELLGLTRSHSRWSRRQRYRGGFSEARQLCYRRNVFLGHAFFPYGRRSLRQNLSNRLCPIFLPT